MISMVRIFGAPVIDPGGKHARTASSSVDIRPEPAPHRGHQLVHGRVALHRHQPRHLHGPGLGDPAEVVADQVHDHQVLGPGLLVRRQPFRDRAVLGRVGHPRRGALDRPALRPAVAVDGQEPLRRRAGHRQVVVAQEGRVRRGVAAPLPQVELERVRDGRQQHPVRQAHLVRLPGLQRGPAARDPGQVPRPGLLQPRLDLQLRDLRYGDRAAVRRTGGRPSGIRRPAGGHGIVRRVHRDEPGAVRLGVDHDVPVRPDPQRVRRRGRGARRTRR